MMRRHRTARRSLVAGFSFLVIGVGQAFGQSNPDKVLWGDTHLHTYLSTDAYFLGNRSVGPDDAYRFAKGAPVEHPYHRARVRLGSPLDFLAVADHAESLGAVYSLLTLRDSRLAATRLGRLLIELDSAGRTEDAFGVFITAINSAGLDDASRPPKVDALTALGWKISDLFRPADRRARVTRWIGSDPSLIAELFGDDILKTHWRSLTEAADRHNDPGRFTALIGWEYTPTPEGSNLHRVVLTDSDGAVARTYLPYSSNESGNPEDLWAWLSQTHALTGADFVSIPHNSNISKGKMFARVTTAGDPITEGYAKLRSTWETVAEVTQIKGTSETHPLLSPNDEFASFEFFNRLIESRIGFPTTPTVEEGDYVRSALKTGLELEQTLGVNPYKLGMIGSTDSHTGLASHEEDNFHGKMAVDSIPANKATGFAGVVGWEMSASGLAAVWARDNTRAEIIAALRRREVYGTTGPKIALRFFGGYGFEPSDLNAQDLATVGYSKGVPMGGDLAGGSGAPTFLVHAVKDPASANLDRIQIIKGWLTAEGVAMESVYDVAWAGNRRPGADGRLPPVGDSVSRVTGGYANTIGESELLALWRDPDFSPGQRAFYYVRVLEIPTPRTSLYDSIALGAPPPEGYAEVIQERAYSSPIWIAGGQ